VLGGGAIRVSCPPDPAADKSSGRHHGALDANGTEGASPNRARSGEKAARVRVGTHEFKKKGVSRFDLRDPYHLAVTLKWPQFLAIPIAPYLLVNVIFAALFWLAPGSVTNAGRTAFRTSSSSASRLWRRWATATCIRPHCMATSSRQRKSCVAPPDGHPHRPTFVRFSRPRAKLVFAPHPVVAVRSGKPPLMLRIGNGRAGVLMDAAAKLNVLLSVTTAEGRRLRRAQELRIERVHLPAFPLFWTLMHVLDERGPLYGYDAARAIEGEAEVFVTIEARDPTLATLVYDHRNYAPEDIRFGMRYADPIFAEDDRSLVADLTRIGALEPDVGERR
jgi:inward rectifier potassium channel